jgi:hypothetical protein
MDTPGRSFFIPFLPVLFGVARPATALELVAAIDLVPTVRCPLISVAYPHGMPTDPDVSIALPSPVSRRPCITVALNGDNFNLSRRRSYLDDDAACKRRSG